MRTGIEAFRREAVAHGDDWFDSRQNAEVVYPDDVLNLVGVQKAVERLPGWAVCRDKPGFVRETTVGSVADAVALIQLIDAVTWGEPVVCDVGINGVGEELAPTIRVFASGPGGWGVPVRALDLLARLSEVFDGAAVPEEPASAEAVRTFLSEQPNWRSTEGGLRAELVLARTSEARRVAGAIAVIAHFHPQRPRCAVEIHGSSVTVRLAPCEDTALTEGVLDVALEAERLVSGERRMVEVEAAVSALDRRP